MGNPVYRFNKILCIGKLVFRIVWDDEIASSSLATQTIELVGDCTPIQNRESTQPELCEKD